MRLHTLKPAKGSKMTSKRLGRGIGSGLGKTSGSGHKGQKARAGGYHKVGFEGGQMPLQRRLPKFGFTSKKQESMAQIRLHQLNNVEQDVIDFKALRESGLIKHNIKIAKVFLAGKINKAISVKGIRVTKGARQAIEAAGGKVIE